VEITLSFVPMPARYSVDEFLDCALEVFVDGGLGAVTIAGVARRSGAPSGSIYHRFSSRDALVAALWLRTVERFQTGYLEALGGDDPDHAAHRAVQHILDWVRARPAEGLLLLRHGGAELLSLDLGYEILQRAASAQYRVEAAITTWRQRHPSKPSSSPARFALVDLPYAAVRPYLPSGDPIPDEIDAVVHDALAAILR
jgi:AcrR family transcriptional regulator